MSKPKRYDLRYDRRFDDSYMEECKDGDYVRSEDYDRLRTECDRLRDAIETWWGGKCPEAWPEQMHRDRPYVNTQGSNERGLVDALAALTQREGDPYVDRIAELSEERPVTRLTVKRKGGEDGVE